MTRPATGTDPSSGGYLDTDNRFQGGHRTGLIGVAFRDARGAATDISPHNPDGSVKFNPLALDNKLRKDLFAQKRVAGVWQINTDPNEGWYLAGAFGDGNGTSTKPSIDTDDQMIEQSNWPFESDITKQDEPFTFQALQNLQPAIMRLRNNLPLADANGNSLVELPGGADAGWSQPLESGKIPRQFLLYGIRKRGAKYVYEVEGYDFATLSNVGERKMGKKGTAAELTYKPEPSGYFMAMVDGKYIPVIRHTWVGGDAWADLGSPVTQYNVGVGAASAGTFTLSYGGLTTATIAYNATSSAVKSALVALDDGYVAADWTVTGTAPTFTVTVPDANKTLTGDGSGLTGGALTITPVP
ncbi:hypothetical protein [Mycobacterium dioxanotrophicus]|uniref:hypothetical protein n=1 Tax=Mycobacterium dioxanotrophicus TaxID=482462 RepID=UPI0018DF7AE3|nr:hypothetical protein [Mycobacterium dioxanotrophicus]